MKKLLLIGIILSTGIVSQAQIKFGVKAGANFSKFSGDDADFLGTSPDMRIGLAGGGLVNISINSTFSVQPELLYSMEGSKYKVDEGKAIFKNDYINVPVLFQYNSSGFYAETGPQIGFLISSKVTDGDESEDTKDEFKSTAFAWTVGFGYRLSSGIGFGARYNLGLSNTFDTEDADVKNSGFHIGISYLFAGK
jgi:hypothetical protein